LREQSVVKVTLKLPFAVQRRRDHGVVVWTTTRDWIQVLSHSGVGFLDPAVGQS